jgi:site-specific DNA-methyltransferase (adenine-specific)
MIAATNVAPSNLTPYYSESGITIYHGDCREILPSLERGLMVTDPPYNVGYHYDDYHDAMSEDDYWMFLMSVPRMPLVFIHYPESLFALAKYFGRAPDEIVAWIYHANTPKQWRAVAWFGISPDLSLDSQSYRNPGDKRIRELIDAGREARLYDWWEIEQVKNVSTEKTDHPCQIPKALMMRAFRVTPFDDGPVIDPFCGSGTILLAAQALGRRAIGIDSSEEYCEIAANRLRQPALALLTK